MEHGHPRDIYTLIPRPKMSVFERQQEKTYSGSFLVVMLYRQIEGFTLSLVQILSQAHHIPKAKLQHTYINTCTYVHVQT